MQTAKQFSVQLVNKPGRFAAVIAALTKEKVGSRAFCVMDSGARGTLRFVPEQPEQASAALDGINVNYDVADVLLVEINAQTGGLPRVCQRLAEDHLNIDYSYGSLLPVGQKGGSLAVIKVNDLSRAQKLLGESAANGQKPRKPQPKKRPAPAAT
jgi:hypothetical protein